MRRMMLAQRLGGIADFALTRQEYQYIAGANARKFANRIHHRVHQVALAFFLLRERGRRALLRRIVLLHRPIAHFNRIEPA
jgi:hypothetical protein